MCVLCTGEITKKKRGSKGKNQKIILTQTRGCRNRWDDGLCRVVNCLSIVKRHAVCNLIRRKIERERMIPNDRQRESPFIKYIHSWKVRGERRLIPSAVVCLYSYTTVGVGDRGGGRGVKRPSVGVDGISSTCQCNMQKTLFDCGWCSSWKTLINKWMMPRHSTNRIHYKHESEPMSLKIAGNNLLCLFDTHERKRDADVVGTHKVPI